MKKAFDRRSFLQTALGAAALAFLPLPAKADLVTFNFLKKKGADFPFKLTEAQWREKLGDADYAILRGGENETSGTSPLLKERRKGTYLCRGCGQPLFSSNAKVMANDWPTFRAPLNMKVIRTSADFGILLPRTEVHCANCGSHLGYKFMVDGQGAENWRYPINGVSLTFRPA